jgi:hypothetical protein
MTNTCKASLTGFYWHLENMIVLYVIQILIKLFGIKFEVFLRLFLVALESFSKKHSVHFVVSEKTTRAGYWYMAGRIPYDGCPFLILGTKILECCFGRNHKVSLDFTVMF